MALRGPRELAASAAGSLQKGVQRALRIPRGGGRARSTRPPTEKLGFSTYGTRLPGANLESLRGHLIVIEGPDGSGRTTECALLKEHLEVQGHAVLETGLRRSNLVSEQIDQAKQGHVLGATTMALFYAVDFADQLENKIVPALSAGSIVLADRYIFTLMARAIVRGASRQWAQKLHAFALRPDMTIFLETRPEILMHRSFGRYGSLDYWESGMDLGISRDRFESFFRYQALLKTEFDWMARSYGFVKINANRSPLEVHRDVRASVQGLLDGNRLESFR
ncbi:MAG: dTMP kinase [Euryarchaeota archaeon]|nr:dTMP kinase [Euryarchaeota archaeon]MDE1837575.1 dTMP kinase [Euryarchaeota archaeon]MDE1881314.1 dTMP kinase [Euryarchaeota archaeon]MDE2045886.1 dTMP kinase [Thermoplasmata archaeon]